MNAIVRWEGGQMVLAAPAVGIWRGGPSVGEHVGPGRSLGHILVLDRPFAVLAPAEAAGWVRARAQEFAPVGYGEPLLTLDPDAPRSVASAAIGEQERGLVLRAPLSGRYYGQPRPGTPPFVRVGDVLEAGASVALLEVMKTYHRILYEGPAMPAPARVVKILVADDEDVQAGQPLLEVEPA